MEPKRCKTVLNLTIPPIVKMWLLNQELSLRRKKENQKLSAQKSLAKSEATKAVSDSQNRKCSVSSRAMLHFHRKWLHPVAVWKQRNCKECDLLTGSLPIRTWSAEPWCTKHAWDYNKAHFNLKDDTTPRRLEFAVLGQMQQSLGTGFFFVLYVKDKSASAANGFSHDFR